MKILQCSSCREDKPQSEFYPDKSFTRGFSYRCRSCQNAQKKARREADPSLIAKDRERSRKWREANPTKSKLGVRSATLHKKYGISEADYKLMESDQEGKCAICGDVVEGNLHVDHDHNTGKVRALLCQACNVTLGKMKESPELLRAAADYLDKHKENSH